MAKPLRSVEPGTPKDMQFAHFGVLDDGAQSKASTLTSIALNVLIAFVIVIIGAAAKKTVDKSRMLTELTEPLPIKKVEPLKPKIIPPKPLPKLPEIPKLAVEPPKIQLPETKLPDIPKTQVVKMDQLKPVIAPAPPKQVVAMAAPVAVSLAHPTAASVVNNSRHASAVALGRTDNPIAPSNARAVASVNLGERGMPGMNASNTGAGPAATRVNLGNGSPGGTTTRGNGVIAAVGLPHGVVGGTGPRNGSGRVEGVKLGQVTPPPMPRLAGPTSAEMRSAPKVIYKPKPVYTAEAIQMHLEGTVSVRIRVLPNGAVEVLGVTSGLGHGLDQSAVRAVEATRFEPATDASGHPISWDGIVRVAFQLAG